MQHTFKLWYINIDNILYNHTEKDNFNEKPDVFQFWNSSAKHDIGLILIIYVCSESFKARDTESLNC